ncbi:uncharacterized protein EI97DRAFT_162678 [Westerdykella ornata]|uniref:Uncharacterized protein n=1 Tax=Westerdykella ornata TaxID=318751 RepID=A0A6A6JAA4_WESOR|nr:uncharacterized protein EI97DRAFT_162678 [Westerdykella ornata]KAF2273174.1 hypothetical protein EI97DRAFT_162678 [Westerdykella ornata]
MASYILSSSPVQPGSAGYASSPPGTVSPTTTVTQYSPVAVRNGGNSNQTKLVEFFSNEIHPADPLFKSRYLRVDGFIDPEQALSAVERAIKDVSLPPPFLIHHHHYHHHLVLVSQSCTLPYDPSFSTAVLSLLVLIYFFVSVSSTSDKISVHQRHLQSCCPSSGRETLAYRVYHSRPHSI